MEVWRRRFVTVDPRTLAALRVALARLLLLDLGKRAAGCEQTSPKQGESAPTDRCS